MWKNLSFKKQLILILLIPVFGLLYFTILNIDNTYQKYTKIENSIQNIDKIAHFSEGIILINNERTLSEYSKFDPNKKVEFKLKMAKTLEWFSKTNSTDSVVVKNIDEARKIINNIHYNAEKNTTSSLKTFNEYTALNNILNNLIDREIVNCDNEKLARLANNLKSYIDSKAATNLIRSIVFDKLIDDTIHSDLYGYYENLKNLNKNADFKLENYNNNKINDEIIKFKKSAEFKSFLATAESILYNAAKITPEAWWNQSTAINDKLNVLKIKKLNYIIDLAKQEKDNTIFSTIIALLSLSILLITTGILVYKLISNTSNSLNIIAAKIEKISLGYTDFQHTLSGNTELDSIRESLKKLTNAIKEQIDLAAEISSGNFGDTIVIRSESDTLNQSLNTMSLELKRFNDETAANSLLEKNIIEINNAIINSKNIYAFGANISKILSNQTNGCQATFYTTDYIDSKNNLIKIGSYADDNHSPEIIAFGEGLIGEVVKYNEQKCLNNLSKEYSFLASSLGKAPIYNVLITPISYKNEVIGVIEIGSLENFNNSHKKLLTTLTNSIGNAIAVFIRNEELKTSVKEINRKNNILQVQEEELRQNNEELNKHTLLLQQSEEILKNQAAELEQTNTYLEEKSRELETKNYEIEKKNDDLVIAQEELNIKSEEIAKASKYKSEFLANMSHELRTPLNSILILSDILRDNTSGNLTNAQLENLSVINTSGKDLLNLITDILDISKIEAGKVEIYPENTITERIFSDMDGLFRAQMEKKKIHFETKITEKCPRKIYSDVGKIEQILKNFLSNALKFTPDGGTVTMTFDVVSEKWEYANPKLALLNNNEILSIEIKDSGIGISEENKKKLFQSFQQADSSTSRKYGGTGLGLYISKQLADLLDGEVFFDSELNNGSTFGLLIPTKFKDNTSIPLPVATVVPEIVKEVQIESEYPKPNEEFVDLSANINDDRFQADIDDKTVLIIEDDPSFAEVLLQVAHNNGFKAIIAHQGETGFQYAKKYNPKAIILDMKLPGIDGWTVLKWLKEDPELKHIPVHVMSGMKREKLAKEMGAFDFLVKPITPEKLKNAFLSIDEEINKVYKKVLILEDDEKLNYSIKQLLHANDKNTICIQAYSRLEAENILTNVEIDCAIIDLGLPDSDNVKAISELKSISKNKNIKIIINTGKTLSDNEQLELEKSVDSIVIKTNNATERLKDEILLFLNKIETSEKTEYKSAPNLSGGEILKDKNILIVDDDIRNIYALSAALTSKGAIITTAFNGLEALNTLEEHPNFDIVLMDIMMPEMDGFEATRKIRENIKWKNLPIIALTAKAMKGDRDEILKAGASDYQSKPIDIQKLISLISIWIYK
ncbi:response regulator [Flavobacterium sufflavum]|uniref:histidine kinase n=1 Tax=Flavobacterium sufflavum TaxID=1921138 RepID=A0A437KY97_9FLAO|nr:response regulator [Flavobacterium sufflavum]RVT77577.1 response regulator [Flavobacterium sufflavum]